MKDKVYECPCCGKDISEFVHQEIVLHNRRANAEKARRAQNKDPEMRKKLTQASAERLEKWRKENPDKLRNITIKASRSRTQETFARQAESLKETARRKMLKFAELLSEAQRANLPITPERQEELTKKASELVRAEIKAERLAAKKAK